MDEFLDELNPWELDEWVAFDLIEGVGLHRLLRTLTCVGSALVSTWGGSIEPGKLEPDDLGAARLARLSAEDVGELEAAKARGVARTLNARARRR